jgi:hypothetical protein
VWAFSQTEMLGDISGLPIEKYLIFLFVPLLSINIYLLIEGFIINDKKMKVKKDE